MECHLTVYNQGCTHLSVPGFKLNHVSEMATGFNVATRQSLMFIHRTGEVKRLGNTLAGENLCSCATNIQGWPSVIGTISCQDIDRLNDGQGQPCVIGTTRCQNLYWSNNNRCETVNFSYCWASESLLFKKWAAVRTFVSQLATLHICKDYLAVLNLPMSTNDLKLMTKLPFINLK